MLNKAFNSRRGAIHTEHCLVVVMTVILVFGACLTIGNTVTARYQLINDVLGNNSSGMATAVPATGTAPGTKVVKPKYRGWLQQAAPATGTAPGNGAVKP